MSTNFIICNFCNKSFVNAIVLKNHQKTAKFCIEMQKRSNQNETNNNELEISYNCEYCDKKFTQKISLKTHYNSCKAKKDLDLKEEKEKEINKLKIKYEKEINELKISNEKEIIYLKEEKEKEINELKISNEKEIFELKQRIQSLSYELEKEKEQNKLFLEEIKDYKNKFFENNTKITDGFIKCSTTTKSTTIYNDNSKNTTQQHIINYNKEFNKLTDELVPFSESYIKNKIKEIVPSQLVYIHNSVVNPNSNIIDYNFACNIVNILKSNVFFTDSARGKLVYKDEDNNTKREMAEQFITDSVVKLCKPEIIDLCKRSLDMVKKREQEFTEKDYAEACLGIKELSTCVNLGKPHAIITEIANKLSKHAKNIPSIKEFKLMLKNSVESMENESILN
jgi:hypothetical protein